MHQPTASKLTSVHLTTYSLGGLAMNLTNLVVSQWLYERYVVGEILSVALFSLILFAERITDGVSDPYVGIYEGERYASGKWDNLRSEER